MSATDLDPLPLDGGNSGLPMFMVTMLRLARILTAKEQERSEISTSQLSRFMHYYRVHLPLTYTSKAIVEQLFSYGGEIAGAGVKVSWQEIMPQEGRKMPRYQFTISRDYEPDRTTTE